MRLFYFLFIVVSFTLATRTPAAEQYQAWFRDGKQFAHDELREIFVPDKSANLGGRPLFDPQNPVRFIRNTRARVQRQGSLLELANGDILPGQIVAYLPSEPGVPGRFVVTLEQVNFDGIAESATITIREGQIRRYLATGNSGGDCLPGRVVTRDGRQWQARSLRFQAGQVQALMKEGVQTAPFAEVARIDFVNVEPLTSLALDAIWSTEPSSLARVRLTNGGEITFSRNLAMRSETSGYCLVRPSWALEPLRFHLRQVVAMSFRDAGEIPLSLLPTFAEERQHPLTIRPVLRNSTADGSLLRLGALSDDCGIAVHAYQSLSFRLPAGTEELTGLIGVSQPVGGGCVKCRLYAGSRESEPIWQSEFLRGGDAPVETKVNLRDVKELIRR